MAIYGEVQDQIERVRRVCEAIAVEGNTKAEKCRFTLNLSLTLIIYLVKCVKLVVIGHHYFGGKGQHLILMSV